METCRGLQMKDDPTELRRAAREQDIDLMEELLMRMPVRQINSAAGLMAGMESSPDDKGTCRGVRKMAGRAQPYRAVPYVCVYPGGKRARHNTTQPAPPLASVSSRPTRTSAPSLDF